MDRSDADIGFHHGPNWPNRHHPLLKWQTAAGRGVSGSRPWSENVRPGLRERAEAVRGRKTYARGRRERAEAVRGRKTYAWGRRERADAVRGRKTCASP